MVRTASAIAAYSAAGALAARRRAWASNTATPALYSSVRHRLVLNEGARGGEHDGHDDTGRWPGGVGIRQERKLLRQHVAGLEVGHHQDVRIARDLRANMLDLGSLPADRVVEGERAVEQAAGDLAALGHLAQCRGVDGQRDLGRHRLDRGEDRDLGPRDPQARAPCRSRSARCRPWSRTTGEPDHGPTLGLLRRFRDEYVAGKPEGRRLIGTYLEIAPSIVAAIDRRRDRDRAWHEIRVRWIDPTIAAIRSHKYEDALRFYRQMVVRLARRHGIKIQYDGAAFHWKRDPRLAL
jgi:hypothetical protein